MVHCVLATKERTSRTLKLVLNSQPLLMSATLAARSQRGSATKKKYSKMGRVATSHPHCLTFSKKLKSLSALDTLLVCLKTQNLYFLRRKSRTRRRPRASPFIPAYRSNVDRRSIIPGGRKDSSILPTTSAMEETT